VKKERWKWDTTLMFKTFHVTAHILGSTCQREQQVKLSFRGGRRRFFHGLFLICLCIKYTPRRTRQMKPNHSRGCITCHKSKECL
jgi:hypothetical protein